MDCREKGDSTAGAVTTSDTKMRTRGKMRALWLGGMGIQDTRQTCAGLNSPLHFSREGGLDHPPIQWLRGSEVEL